MNATLGTLALISALFTTNAQAQSGAFAGQVPVNAALKQTLTSRSAKPGQEITAVTEKPVTIGSLTLQRGSLLLGHVVDVTRHTKASPNGSLVIVFDHAKPKNGDPVEIRSSVYRISLSDNQILAQRRDVDMGMRGSAAEQNTTSAVRAGTDHDNNMVQGMQSDANAPVQVVSAVPGVALSAVASDSKSGIFTAKNADVELGASMEMVVGVAVKQ